MKRHEAEAARPLRGQLKIFLGMAAGVGKTYAMLEAAHERKAEGVDVVVGYVETYRRAPLEALVMGLEVIPHRENLRQEMNLDGVLARRPALVLIDELAHTNAAGARHVRRYQDVLELLDAGIGVYATVNVAHFESRVDTVKQITGVTITERLPDSILDMADEIELIDLSPQDLRKRLYEGKVNTGGMDVSEVRRFFREGNLTALREMALRLTAERVDHQLQDYMQAERISGPWKSSERLMIAIGPSPYAEGLVRWARKAAYSMEAPWMAAYIRTSRPLSAADEAQLAANLRLAQSLGAEVVMTIGDDITEALLHLARQRNVTQIIVGKTQQGWLSQLLRRGSPTGRLIRESGDIDVVVISADTPPATGFRLNLPQIDRQSTWWQYVLAALVVFAVVLEMLATDWFSYVSVGLTELAVVLMVAVYMGRGPALLAATLSALAWNFLFLEPRFAFRINREQDVILFALYFIIALFTGGLTSRLRRQERQARYNSERNMALYRLAQDVSAAVDMNDIIRIAVEQIGRAFDADVGVWLAEEDVLSREAHPFSTFKPDAGELDVALWTFENGRQAGQDTDTHAQAVAHYFPLLTSGIPVGVLGFRPRAHESLTYEQELLLETFVTQLALSVERELLEQAAKRAAMHMESERLYATLLNSISHELRTPITAIAGTAGALIDPHAPIDTARRQALGRDIQEAADRLNRLVENLLDMSRLDSGRLTLKRDWCDVCEVMGSAVNRLRRRINGRPVTVDCGVDVPLIPLDFVLLEQAIVNLIDNACAYTPPDAPIILSSRLEGRTVLVSVEDGGKGIPARELTKVFEKFYRIDGTVTGGTGLGLSIVEGIVNAHGGTIRAENVPHGGARFTITLPFTETAPQVQEAGQ